MRTFKIIYNDGQTDITNADIIQYAVRNQHLDIMFYTDTDGEMVLSSYTRNPWGVIEVFPDDRVVPVTNVPVFPVWSLR